MRGDPVYQIDIAGQSQPLVKTCQLSTAIPRLAIHITSDSNPLNMKLITFYHYCFSRLIILHLAILKLTIHLTLDSHLTI